MACVEAVNDHSRGGNMRLINSLQEFLQAQQQLRDLRFLNTPQAEGLKNELRLRMELALEKGVVHFAAEPGKNPVLKEGPRK